MILRISNRKHGPTINKAKMDSVNELHFICVQKYFINCFLMKEALFLSKIFF